jgi:hypothetical protein
MDGNIDQCRIALKKIESDPGTRRTYMPIFSVNDHINPEGEVPCAAGFQIFHRAGQLHGVTVMRAQNALNSLPMDIFVFTSFLQYLAACMNVPVGTYSHLSTTFHLFQRDQPMARAITSNHSLVTALTLGSARGFPNELTALLDFEAELRASVIDGDVQRTIRMTGQLNLESGWGRHLAKLLLAIAFKKIGQIDEIRPLDLPPDAVDLLCSAPPVSQEAGGGSVA